MGLHGEASCGGFRILTVDDEPIVHEILAKIIGSSNLPVSIAATANSGGEALRLVGEIRPDICILDISMPEMTGLEVTEKMEQALDYRPAVIYLTAYERFDYAQEALRLGALDYILKPIRRDELIRTLKRVVNYLQAERIESLEREKLKERMQGIVPSAVASDKGMGSRASSIVKEVRNYIDEHYRERINLAVLAEHVCLSPGYLGPLFKAECGFTFRQYLRSVRVTKAKDLMKSPRLNLTEIADAVGFNDYNYFSQAFMEETGVRPSEYRGGGRHWARSV